MYDKVTVKADYYFHYADTVKKAELLQLSKVLHSWTLSGDLCHMAGKC